MGHMRPWVWVILAGIGLGTAGCSAAEKARFSSTVGLQPVAGGPAAVGRLPLRSPALDESDADSLPAVTAALTDPQPNRYLIKNASVTMEVPDLPRAQDRLLAAVRAARGYVGGLSESGGGLGERSVSLTVRLPADRFDRSLQQIETLGKVLEKQVTVEDVSEEFVDTQARLRNLKRTETRLQEHLRRTARLADILLVEKELDRVRGEIERLEGRLRFLEHQVAYSTLSITLREAPHLRPVMPVESYSTGKVASDAIRSLVGLGRVVWTVAIWLGIWAVVWLPLALGGWVVYRLRRVAQAG